MRFPRLTTRRLMVLVSVVALLLGAAIEAMRLSSLARQYRKYAILLAFDELRFRDRALRVRQKPGKGPHDLRTIEYSRRLANYYSAWKRRYEQAARYPWLPGPPGPPTPE